MGQVMEKESKKENIVFLDASKAKEGGQIGVRERGFLVKGEGTVGDRCSGALEKLHFSPWGFSISNLERYCINAMPLIHRLIGATNLCSTFTPAAYSHAIQ